MREILELSRRLEQDPLSTRGQLEAFVKDRVFPIVDLDTATFFYWSDRPLDAIYLVHWVFGLESRQPFARLEGTDAWYLPLELPHSARVEYKFELVRGGQRAWIRDPLNPRRAFDPFGSNSVCPMPGYREPPWIEPDPGARQGRLELIPVRSAVYDQMREARVYMPAEYKPHKRYPLIVCHDGSDYLKYAGIKTVLDNLIHRHEVAPLLVAFTDGVSRNPEYGANPLQARYLVEELLPAVVKRFGVHPDPEKRGLMGASFGGVSSLFTAWHHPGVFGKLLLQSGSFVFTDVGTHDRGPLFDPVVDFVNTFRGDPGRVDARVFMSCGTFESLIYYNRSLLPLMRRSGIEVRYVESQDGHNWIAWRDRLREGLSWLFPGHLWMYYE
jgi:enterochelin esterase-like enzyme